MRNKKRIEELSELEYDLVMNYRQRVARDASRLRLRAALLSMTARYMVWHEEDFKVGSEQIVSFESVVFTWLRLYHNPNDPYEAALYKLALDYNDRKKDLDTIGQHLFSHVCNMIGSMTQLTDGMTDDHRLVNYIMNEVPR